MCAISSDLFNNKAFQVVQNDLSTKNAVSTYLMSLSFSYESDILKPVLDSPGSSESSGT